MSSSVSASTPPLWPIVTTAFKAGTWPPLGVTEGASPFNGAVFDGTRLWFIPYSADRILYMRPGVITVSTVALPAAGSWAGAAFDGRYIWCAPYAPTYVLQIDTVTQRAVQLPDDLSAYGSRPFTGATFDGTLVWFAPCSSTSIVTITVTNSQLFAPYTQPFPDCTAADDQFRGIVPTDTFLYFVPFNAEAVVYISPGSTIATPGSISLTTSGVNPTFPGKFSGGTFDGSRVWLVPYNAAAIVYITTTAGNTVSTIALSTIPGRGGDSYVAALHDGYRVWLVPAAENAIVAIDTRTTFFGLATVVQLPPRPNGVVSMAFSDACFDRKGMWLAPQAPRQPPLYISRLVMPKTRTRSLRPLDTESVTISHAASISNYVFATTTVTPSVETPSPNGTGTGTGGSASGTNNATPSINATTATTSGSKRSRRPTASPSYGDRTVTRSCLRSVVGPSRTVARDSYSATDATVQTSSTSWSRTTSLPDGTASRGSASTTESLSHTEAVRPPPRALALLPAVATAVTVSFVAVSSTVAVTNAGGGPTGGRVVALLRIASCTDDAETPPVQEPLDVTSHPLRFPLPAAGLAVQYDAGLILGNAVLSMGALGLVLVAAIIKYASGHATRQGLIASGESDEAARSATWRSSCGWARFPSLVTPLHGYVLCIVAQSATNCVLIGNSGGVVLGVWGWMVCAIATSVVGYCTGVVLPRWMKVVDADAVGRRQPIIHAMSVVDRMDHVLFGSDLEWVLAADDAAVGAWTHTSVLGSFGAFFDDFTFRCRWWLAFELGIGVVSGALSGLTEAISCAWAGWLAFVPPVVYVVALFALSPHQRRADRIVARTVALLLLLGGFAVALNVTFTTLQPVAATVASWCAVTASIIGLVPMLFSPYRFIKDHSRYKRTAELQRQQRLAAEAARQLSLISLAPLPALVGIALRDDDEDARTAAELAGGLLGASYLSPLLYAATEAARAGGPPRTVPEPEATAMPSWHRRDDPAGDEDEEEGLAALLGLPKAATLSGRMLHSTTRADDTAAKAMKASSVDDLLDALLGGGVTDDGDSVGMDYRPLSSFELL